VDQAVGGLSGSRPWYRRSCRKGADCDKKRRTIQTTNQWGWVKLVNHIVQVHHKICGGQLSRQWNAYLDKIEERHAWSSWAEAIKECFLGADALKLSYERESLYFFHMWKPMGESKLKQFSFRLPHFGSIDNPIADEWSMSIDTEGRKIPPNRGIEAIIHTAFRWLARLI